METPYKQQRNGIPLFKEVVYHRKRETPAAATTSVSVTRPAWMLVHVD
jgi:hypothetical protein